jgi:hypothetical protein
MATVRTIGVLYWQVLNNTPGVLMGEQPLVPTQNRRDPDAAGVMLSFL